MIENNLYENAGQRAYSPYGRSVSLCRRKREPVDPEHLKPEDRMKFEIAKELGLADKVIAGGWRCLTAKESGRIGGLVTKKKREMSAKTQDKENPEENCH